MAPVARRLVDHQSPLLLEAAVAGGGRLPRSKPSVVLVTAQPLLSPPTTLSSGQRGVGEEHLVELGGAVGLRDRPHLDAGLLHRHEQVGDARVLRRVGSVRASRKQ